MLLAMLAIAESHRVQQYVRLVNDADFNSGASASRADGASAKSSARNLELKAILADPRSFSQHMDILLSHMVGNTKSKEEIRTLSGEVEAMMANPLLQEQATLVAQQLEKVMMDADFKKQVEQLLEQAEEFVMQIQTMMTDARLQGEVEWLAHQMEEGMSADGKARDHANTLAKWTELVEKMMANPRLNEHARRLFKQLEAMEANQKFQDQATSFAQLMDTLMADPNFQRHARRIAAHMEAIRSHLTSQNMGGGPTADLFSLAEVDRSSSKVSFVPLRPPARTPFAVASRSAASQGPLALAPAKVWSDYLGPHSHSHRPQLHGEMRPRHIQLKASTGSDENLEQWISQVRTNIIEGDFGTRGEAWVAGQAALLIGVLVAPELPDFASTLLGLLGIALGGALVAGAVFDLGSNLTPWPKPVKANELRTDGAYALSRHPIYAGLIVGCLGVSLITQSYERLLLTNALYILLANKASREEEWLIDKHGEVYTAYAGRVPRFFPDASQVPQTLKIASELAPRVARAARDITGRNGKGS